MNETKRFLTVGLLAAAAAGCSGGEPDQPDPTVFKIVNGRLMLFARGDLEKWNAEDESLALEKADGNWRHFLQQGP